jgi:hypothetical protein
MIQFRSREVPSIFVSLNTLPIFSYFTLASGGYIIRIRPMASGILVVPLEKELIKSDEDGKRNPIDTPIAIARKIHKVRYRSRKLNFFLSCAGAQLLADIFFC